MRNFHAAPLQDEWKYLFLDGVSLRVRRPAGRNRMQMFMACGVRANGSRQLLAFQRSKGESQYAWEGLLRNLYSRRLIRQQLTFVVSDGCAGLAAALQVVYPQALHQRCWVHKTSNVFERVRRKDVETVKSDAQAINQARSRSDARDVFCRLKRRWAKHEFK